MPKKVKLCFDIEVLGWEGRKGDSYWNNAYVQRQQYACKAMRENNDILRNSLSGWDMWRSSMRWS